MSRGKLIVQMVLAKHNLEVPPDDEYVPPNDISKDSKTLIENEPEESITHNIVEGAISEEDNIEAFDCNSKNHFEVQPDDQYAAPKDISEDSKTLMEVEPEECIPHSIVEDAMSEEDNIEAFDSNASSDEYIPTNDSSEESDIENIAVLENESTRKTRTSKRKSKGQGDSSHWARQSNAELRLKGCSYTGFKKDANGKYLQTAKKRKREMNQRCEGHFYINKKRGPQQNFECSSITDEQREDIFLDFWKLNTWEAKHVYVSGLVVHTEPKHPRRSTEPEQSRKKIGFKYSLKVTNGNNAKLYSVCKKMFLATLAIGERAMRSWVLQDKKINKAIEEENENLEIHTEIVSSSKTEMVKTFLNSLPKVESHYCRASTSKQYLEPIWDSYRHLHREFNVYCERENKSSCSWRTFMKVFKSMNLEIYTPKKDQCNTCLLHRNGTIPDEDYNSHMNRKDDARKEKAQDKERANSPDDDVKVSVYTVDLQAVLLSPRLEAAAMYYKTKLKVHNWTYYNLQDKDVTCFVWHEGNGGLESDVFTSIATKFLRSEIEKQQPSHIIIWSDGCGYQNRNNKLSNGLLDLAMQTKVTIEQKYLEVGHTQMEVDSIHSSIERKLSRRRQIFVPADYIHVISSARIDPFPYKVISVTQKDFFKHEGGLYSSIRPGNRKGDPCVTDMCAIQYLPAGIIKYKLKFDDMWTELPRRPSRVRRDVQQVNLYHESPCSIEQSKFLHLQELKQFIPQDHHHFYNNLNHNCSHQTCPHIRQNL